MWGGGGGSQNIEMTLTYFTPSTVLVQCLYRISFIMCEVVGFIEISRHPEPPTHHLQVPYQMIGFLTQQIIAEKEHLIWWGGVKWFLVSTTAEVRDNIQDL